MRILCYVNHYFGAPAGFEGRSTDASNASRAAAVEACIEQLRAIEGAEVRVCGIPGRSLVPIDIDLSQVAVDPKLLIYESLAHQAGHLDEYDYFINIEDDVLMPAATFLNVVEFDRESLPNEVLHPNRLEIDDTGEPFCVDLKALPGWTYQRRPWRGRELRVALNPHSALLVLSRDKFRYALEHIDRSYRGRFLKWEMDSAFAYYLSPFALFRPYEDLTFHTVTHLDRWAGPARQRPTSPTPRAAASTRPAPTVPRWKALVRELVPPLFLRLLRRRGR